MVRRWRNALPVTVPPSSEGSLSGRHGASGQRQAPIASEKLFRSSCPGLADRDQLGWDLVTRKRLNETAGDRQRPVTMFYSAGSLRAATVPRLTIKPPVYVLLAAPEIR